MDHKIESSKCYILQDENAIEKLGARHFDLDFWRDKPGFEVVEGGRGGSVRIDINGRIAILRQYRRGGFIQNIYYFSNRTLLAMR